MGQRQTKLKLPTLKIHNCLARRFATDFTLYKEATNALKLSLASHDIGGNIVLQRLIIRSDRNARYISRTEHFTKVGRLGSGSFGSVDLVTPNDGSGRYYALKKIRISRHADTAIHYNSLVIERDAHIATSSEHVVILKGAWIEKGYLAAPDYACLLLELMRLGDLSSFIGQLHPMAYYGVDFRGNDGLAACIRNQPNERLPENLRLAMTERLLIQYEEARVNKYMRTFVGCIEMLVSAVSYLHSKKIVHRDIKPGNILVSGNMRLKLTDFGLATPFKPWHAVERYGWFSAERLQKKTLPETFELQEETEFERAHQALRRKSQMEHRQPGTWIYQAPELCGMSPWSRNFGPYIPPQAVPVYKHYAGDWYGVGCVIYEIVTGLRLIEGASLFFNVRPNERKRYWELIKLRPEDYNSLLYQVVATDPSPTEFILNRRFLPIVRSLITASPNNRWNGDDVMGSLAFNYLKEQYPFNPDDWPLWQWNEFINREAPSKPNELISNFEFDQHSAPASPARQGPFKGAPELPHFATMMPSPGIIATVRRSPQG